MWILKSSSNLFPYLNWKSAPVYIAEQTRKSRKRSNSPKVRDDQA